MQDFHQHIMYIEFYLYPKNTRKLSNLAAKRVFIIYTSTSNGACTIKTAPVINLKRF